MTYADVCKIEPRIIDVLHGIKAAGARNLAPYDKAEAYTEAKKDIGRYVGFSARNSDARLQSSAAYDVVLHEVMDALRM